MVPALFAFLAVPALAAACIAGMPPDSTTVVWAAAVLRLYGWMLRHGSVWAVRLSVRAARAYWQLYPVARELVTDWHVRACDGLREVADVVLGCGDMSTLSADDADLVSSCAELKVALWRLRGHTWVSTLLITVVIASVTHAVLRRFTRYPLLTGAALGTLLLCAAA